MWSKSDKTVDKFESSVESVSLCNARDAYLSRANAAKKIAETYKRNGDEQNYQCYMSEYERCMDKYHDLQSTYRRRCANK